MASVGNPPLPHLASTEISLLEFAADDPRDTLALSDREELILRLYDQIQEQKLERALLEQELKSLSGDHAEEQLAIAERELLQSRATYTVKRKAVEMVLMTDPTLKAVHMEATSPIERDLLRLVNRRDALSFVHENLIVSRNEVQKTLSDLEFQNLQIIQKNRELAQQLLGITGVDNSWRDRLGDVNLQTQLVEAEVDYRQRKAKWDIMKNTASAIVVGSGVNWADNEVLRDLVLDEMDD